MRRVSSRQRLVSWDAFDATAPDEEEEEYDSSNVSDNDDDNVGFVISYASDNDDGYDTALEEGSNVGLDLTFHQQQQQHESSLMGRKRDRSTRRQHKGPFTSTSSPVCKIVSTPKAAKAPPTGTAKTTLSPLAVPALIPSYYTWENDDFLPYDDHLKNSTSANTLSSFVSTSSTLLPSPSSASVATNANATTIHLNELMKDMHLAIFAFLDLNSLQSIMAVNTEYRQLVLSQDAQTSLWKRHCQEKWKVGVLKSDDDANAVTESSIRYLDKFHLPTAAAAAANTINLPLLLHMTPSECPAEVDQDLVDQQNLRTERLRPLRNLDDAFPRALPPIEQMGYLRSYRDEKTGRRLVQYTGPIGAGDRCIRSDRPLSRPKQEEANEQQLQQPKSRFLVNLLRRSANKVMPRNRSSTSLASQQEQLPKPFVVPFMENNTTVNVTPRLISYYEVSILAQDKEPNHDDDDDSVVGAGPAAAAAGRRTDCVAVGLAAESFPVHTRMPGWDRQSFGYHGDDGGIFHSSGAMIRRFGSKFGVGDTVGCGIDFMNQGIFFTLNGLFLGYGWTGVDEGLLQKDMYPVVGLDTNCPLYLNFGADEPFQFDLSEFLMKHETIIAPQYTLEKSMTPMETIAAAAAAQRLTREFSIRSFPSTSSLASLASSASSSTGRRLFRRRSDVRERSF